MKHIREFDGLRGLLALWVFATHALELGPYSSLARVTHANMAVDIFIILSGFVIFHLLSNGEDYRTFITRRWFRLFPVFAICFLIALALYAVRGTDDEIAFGLAHMKKIMPYLVTHATMLHGIVPDPLLPHTARAILVPAWSVSVEWQFYLLAPLLFAFATRPNWKVTLLTCALLAIRVLHDMAHAGVIRGSGALTFDMAAFLPLRLEYFAVGAGSYGVWRWLSQRTEPLKVPRVCYALLLPVLILVAKRSPAIGLWLAGMLVLANVYFGRASYVPRLFSRVLNSSSTQFLGKLSYCIYLLHLPALVFVRQIIRIHGTPVPAPSFQSLLVIGGFVTTIAGAWLIHTVVEYPMICFGKQLTKSWKEQTPAPGALRPA